MTKNDAALLAIGDFAIATANRHSNLLKIYLQRFEVMEQVIKKQAEILQSPDGFERDREIQNLAAAVAGFANLKADGIILREQLAREESEREQAEAYMARLRASLEAPPGGGKQG